MNSDAAPNAMTDYSCANNPLNSSACNPEPGNNGNIAYIADTVNVGWSQTFTYDGLNRLTSAARSDSGYNHTYNYDSFGNLLIHDNITPGPTYNINPATNQLNRWNSVTNAYNTYAYDAAGNLINSGTSDIGGHSFTYDGFGRINAVDSGATAAYGFNGIDERIFKQTAAGWTDYMYLNSQPIAEWAQDGAWTDYIYAEGQKIAKVATPSTGPSTLNYYLDDHLGTTQVELDSSGNVTWQGQFTPFGAELPDGSTTMRYKFTGKERDAESGLDFFGARYYASPTGRWMSPDWAEKPEAVPYSSLGDPQSLNLYAYVGNNPLSKADADGHCLRGDDGCLSTVGDSVDSEYYHEIQTADYLTDHGATEVNQDGTTKTSNSSGAAQQNPNRQSDGSYKATPAQLADLRAKAKNKEHVYSPSDPANGPNPGQCVTACERFTGVPGPTTSWRFGKAATDLTDDDIGTAIATRVGSGSDARYGGNVPNSGVFMGKGIGGIWFADQWPKNDGNKPVSIWFMPTNNTQNPGNSAMSASYYGVIVK